MLTKDQLTAPRAATPSGFPEDDVTVANLGTVRVRGLSRVEGFLLQKIDDLQTRERRMLSLALIDPPMAENEVGDWQKRACSGELDPVAAKVLELSGQQEGAGKLIYKDFEVDPGSEFRVLPSDETLADGGGAAFNDF